VLNGNYNGDTEKHIRQIDKWVEQQVLRETAPRPAGFVKTKVAERIYAVSRWVQKINTIGLIHGPAGIGKTITLEAIRAETPGSIYVRIATAGQSKLAVMEKISSAARMGGLKLTASRTYETLVDMLRDTNRLIIVDEIHKLAGRQKDDALHALRDLHDDTKCPMLWAGMSSIADYISTAKNDVDSLDQVDSRIKFRLNLKDVAERTDGGPGLYTVDDIRKWISAQKIRVTDDAVRYLQMLANTPGMGGLRTCDGLLRVAVSLSNDDDKPISSEMLREIREEQLGVRAAEQFERQMQMRAAKVG
jgi:DNA transposition AAA+ family ATPase